MFALTVTVEAARRCSASDVADADLRAAKCRRTAAGDNLAGAENLADQTAHE